MTVLDPFVCPKCLHRAEYHGRVSYPASMIYKCAACGHENFIANRPLAGQQQQQPQRPEED